MKRIIKTVTAAILVLLQIFTLSSCKELFKEALAELETYGFNSLFGEEKTSVTDAAATKEPHQYETEAPYGDETDAPYFPVTEKPAATTEKPAAVTEKPVERIPYSSTPAVYRYTLPDEFFSFAVEKEASEIIDDAICKATASLQVMADDRHSYVSYRFDRDANGYISELSKTERALYDTVVAHGRNFENFTLKAEDYDGDLKNDYFNIYKALTQCNPDLSSYYDIKPVIGGQFVGDDVVTFMKSVSDSYFDPYQDQNYSVTEGKTTMEDVKYAARLLDAIVNRIVRFMPEGLTTYDKYYYLAAVLSEHVTYDLNARNKFTAFGALVGGKAVCEGYANAYMLLCEKADLWCAYRNGIIRGDGHAWNMVKLDSGIYNVDVTWCDVCACYEKGFYKNFMKSDADFKANGHENMDGLPSTGTYEPCPYE